ncbi:MAG: hypothetical protein PQJ44_09230, partial [Sphaerochaetaceae bacterium]|nr:hypothetical protein [Sphaerochaetaceae bacterium]
LKPYFKEVIEEEEYIDTIKNSTYLLTGSYQAACESLACGNKPVLLKREDKIYNNTLNIPEITMGESLSSVIEEFDKIVQNYPKDLKNIEPLTLDSIIEAIDKRAKLLESVSSTGVFEN